MQKSNKIRLAAFALLILSANCLCGCSVVGMGVGATIDSHRRDCKIVEKEDVASIKPDTKITVYTWDGSQKTGEFGGLDPQPLSQNPEIQKELAAAASEKRILIRNIMSSYSTTTTDSSLQPSEEYVDFQDIAFIEAPRRKSCKWVGLGLGLLVDGAVVAAAIAISSMGPMM
jgi:hypothetical protein